MTRRIDDLQLLSETRSIFEILSKKYNNQNNVVVNITYQIVDSEEEKRFLDNYLMLLMKDADVWVVYDGQEGMTKGVMTVEIITQL